MYHSNISVSQTQVHSYISASVNKVKTVELTEEIKKQYFEELLQGYTTDVSAFVVIFIYIKFQTSNSKYNYTSMKICINFLKF